MKVKSINLKLSKVIALVLLVSLSFSCKPTGEKMVEKMQRKIEKTEQKITKFENKKTGFQQKLEIAEKEAANQINVVDKNAVKNKKKLAKLQKEIEKLKLEVNDSLPDAEVELDDKVVTVLSLQKKDFKKYIEVQGAVTSKDIVMVSSNTGGVLSSVSVIEGQYVSAGQTIAVVNSDVLQSSIAEVENAMILANTVYEKQKRLWLELNVGTEIQYLQAKNNKENLEKKLETLQIQLGDATVKSTISGVVDEVFGKSGEMAGPGSPIARVVNLNKVQVEAEVPESYISKINKGDQVEVYFASIETTRSARIRAVSQTLNPGNRTFKIEIDLPNGDKKLKPYLLGKVKIKEYESKNQLVVPTKLIQAGSKGDFVFTLKDGVVIQSWIEKGKSYNGETEIVEGLTGEEAIIDLGFRNVLPGDEVSVYEEEKEEA